MMLGVDISSLYKSFLEFVRFEVLMVVTVKIIILWDMMPYGVILFFLEDGGSRFPQNVGI
jgi:hypothetical protein